VAVNEQKRKASKVLCLNRAFHQAAVWCKGDWEYFFFLLCMWLMVQRWNTGNICALLCPV